MKAGLDSSGNPVAWYSRVAAPSSLATLLKLPLKEGIDPQAVTAFVDQPYSIPNVRIEYAQRNPHVPVGFWRTVGHSQNPFMRECFVDVREFAGYRELGQYLDALSPAELQAYRDAARDFFASPAFQPFSAENFADRFVDDVIAQVDETR